MQNIKCVVEVPLSEVKVGESFIKEVPIGVLPPLKLQEFIVKNLKTDKFYCGVLFGKDYIEHEFKPDDWNNHRSVKITYYTMK